MNKLAGENNELRMLQPLWSIEGLLKNLTNLLSEEQILSIWNRSLKQRVLYTQKQTENHKFVNALETAEKSTKCRHVMFQR